MRREKLRPEGPSWVPGRCSRSLPPKKAVEQPTVLRLPPRRARHRRKGCQASRETGFPHGKFNSILLAGLALSAAGKASCTQPPSRCSFNHSASSPGTDSALLPPAGPANLPPDPGRAQPGLLSPCCRAQHPATAASPPPASPACSANCLALKSEHGGLQQLLEEPFCRGVPLRSAASLKWPVFKCFPRFLRGWCVVGDGEGDGRESCAVKAGLLLNLLEEKKKMMLQSAAVVV